MIQYATFIQAAGAQAGAADTEEARPEVEAVILAEIAASTGPGSERAQELLERLRRLVPSARNIGSTSGA